MNETTMIELKNTHTRFQNNGDNKKEIKNIEEL